MLSATIWPKAFLGALVLIYITTPPVGTRCGYDEGATVRVEALATWAHVFPAGVMVNSALTQWSQAALRSVTTEYPAVTRTPSHLPFHDSAPAPILPITKFF